jgi:hypothetical protein
MGMFTTIIHPGGELQIKCGSDMCDTYHVGQYVESCIGSYPFEGYLLDGVYHGYECSNNKNKDGIAIIKKCRIIAVLPYKGNSISALERKYKIRSVSKYHWTDEIWEDHIKAEEKAKEEAIKIDKQLEGKSNTSKLAYIGALMLSKRLNYSSLASKIFTIEPMPMPGDLPKPYVPPAPPPPPPMKIYDVVRTLIDLKLSGSADDMEMVICKTMKQLYLKKYIGNFVVYVYPERKDFDIVLSWGQIVKGGSYKFTLFNCKKSKLVKGLDTIYEVMQS